MFVSHTLRRRPARRGAILIVVLAMLALFAVVGLSFVLYADSQANAAKPYLANRMKNRTIIQ